ncbi:MAG: hypothetical protein L7S64_02255, partial [Longimicrobiales bacterium]|nr:hypothetical protein [Longimicrobiales bacterium]
MDLPLDFHHRRHSAQDLSIYNGTDRSAGGLIDEHAEREMRFAADGYLDISDTRRVRTPGYYDHGLEP